MAKRLAALVIAGALAGCATPYAQKDPSGYQFDAPPPREAVDVQVNAKNRLGAYTGWRPYHVTFSGGVPTNAYEWTPGAPDVLWHLIGQ